MPTDYQDIAELIERLHAYKTGTSIFNARSNPLMLEAATALERLSEEIEWAAGVFDEYAEMHAAKLPPDWKDAPGNWREIAVKVERNRQHAIRLRAALNPKEA